jgi:predicted glycoside hydrolase/deacetylase ChbG (UPF0249 family)
VGVRPWLRDPFDTPGRILARGINVAKHRPSPGWRPASAAPPARAAFAPIAAFRACAPSTPLGLFAADFRRFLVAPGPLHLVMCHPGHVDDELGALDPVVATRPLELAYFASEAFPADLAEAGCQLARFPRDQ